MPARNNFNNFTQRASHVVLLVVGFASHEHGVSYTQDRLGSYKPFLKHQQASKEAQGAKNQDLILPVSLPNKMHKAQRSKIGTIGVVSKIQKALSLAWCTVLVYSNPT